ncbi:efflux RND transporter periplasmic adaptor subunit [Pseudohalioglobus sediminis]|uniref:Efflux RND transporter periplasmic adaptor subunit n=1 Tax=Pseudohalioglobus sediminis TaxID=2606449 RepID=A0A5B0WRK0_9GAMM|nr:efflux RND transporter periplasmic adaptor subunit [Pseudohalioglobus sediminis]KAA1189573.1 efflux RND transporter periplasmic adaptor subunit [Pseudohalioglobus sediminis]
MLRIQLLSVFALALFALPTLAQPATAPVSVEVASERDITQVIQLSGTVTAERHAELSVATSGLVTALAVDAGTQVDAGQPLLELDAELAQYQYRSALAAESQAERALADARRRLEEARSLAPNQSIAKTVVRDLEAEVAEDEAALERARAESGYRRGILARHELKAPFAGVISDRSAELGEWVTPGQPVLTLISTASLRLDLQVPEDYLGMVDTDTPVAFSLGAQRDKLYRGKVLSRVPAPDPNLRTFLVRVGPAESIPRMLPGMSARAELRLPTGQRRVTVPRDAVLRYSDGRIVVWVVEEVDGVPTAAERLVQVGFRFDGRIEITSGISAGEQVVITGNESLRNGQAVSVYQPEG